ncbi:MAG: hypothetical protein IPH72_27075 [Sandaracinaceae bacterium]|nr:hypothetical protein [Sandaracinaceae bacterium]
MEVERRELGDTDMLEVIERRALAYDDGGRLQQVTHIAADGAIPLVCACAYDERGLLESLTCATPNTTERSTFEYDEAGRLTATSASRLNTRVYYDAEGRRERATHDVPARKCGGGSDCVRGHLRPPRRVRGLPAAASRDSDGRVLRLVRGLAPLTARACRKRCGSRLSGLSPSGAGASCEPRDGRGAPRAVPRCARFRQPGREHAGLATAREESVRATLRPRRCSSRWSRTEDDRPGR